MTKESEAKTRVIQRHGSAKHPPRSAEGEQIVFQCPSGHRIVVSAGLAGKRGKCSKCGVAVEIPRPSAAAATPQPTPLPVEAVMPPPAETSELPIQAASPLENEQAPVAAESWDFIGDHAGEDAWSTEPAGSQEFDPGHPTASLVARLWAERAHGGVIELHLVNGSVLLPEWYDATWSRGSHGLFASQAADGTITLTAVAWETVQKVIVRKLTAVPDDMFA